MMRRRSAECASDLRLERWLTGELSAEDVATLKRHLASCTPCRERHALLEGEHRALSTRLPPLAESRAGAVPAVTPRRGLTRVAWTLGSLAAALALWTSLEQRAPTELTRTKGSGAVRLDWVVRRDGVVFTPSADEPLRPGDALRFGLATSRRGQASVLSLDGAGRTSIYHDWVTIEAGVRQLLPGAVELDDVVGEEHLYGIVCERVEPLTALQDAIRGAPTEPALPTGCSVDHHVVRKERP